MVQARGRPRKAEVDFEPEKKKMFGEYHDERTREGVLDGMLG